MEGRDWSKLQGSIKKGVKFPRGDKEKIMWNFHKSCVLAMEFSSVKWCCCTILQTLQGRSFASSRIYIDMGKVKNLKIPGGSSKIIFSSFMFGFFLRSPI